LELAFATKALRHVCEKESRAVRELGATVAKNLRARLADLTAADTIADLPFQPLPLDGKSLELAMTLGNGYKLILAPNHAATPVLHNDALDWSRVTRIKLLRIES
jgi:hypothetical protein